MARAEAAALIAETVGDVLAHEQIEQSVPVVIEECGAGGEAGVADAGGAGHVGEGAIAVVMVENAAAEAGDEQVLVAIGVVIANGAADRVELLSAAGAVDAGLVGHVLEAMAAEVAEEAVAQRRPAMVTRQRRSLYQVGVQPAVTIRVEQGAAAAGKLRIVAAARAAVVADEADAPARRLIHKPWNERRRGSGETQSRCRWSPNMAGQAAGEHGRPGEEGPDCQCAQ